MKTAAIPALTINASLRRVVEGVLAEGQALAAFIEPSIQDNVRRRQMQSEFIARGLASRDDVLRTGIKIPAAEVLASAEAANFAREGESEKSEASCPRQVVTGVT